MGFLRKLFGGGDSSPGEYVDKNGIYFHVGCDQCGSVVRLRIDKQHDLNSTPDGGYIWHKTIIDSKCFRQMPAVVRFDRSHNIISAEINGGMHISEEAYQQAITSVES